MLTFEQECGIELDLDDEEEYPEEEELFAPCGVLPFEFSDEESGPVEFSGFSTSVLMIDEDTLDEVQRTTEALEKTKERE